jgi:hypothetical protein
MNDNAENLLVEDSFASEIAHELAPAYDRDLRRLSDLAFVFLSATDGDQVEAENLLDNAIDLLFEGGVLSMWRYRIVLAGIRGGL